MNENHTLKISEELNLKYSQVQSVCALLEEDATIPFIARYRKEATGSLDEVAVTSIRDRLLQLKELDSRRETILKSLEEHGHLTDELKEKVIEAETLSVLEDIYLPYRPKRRTKATIAKEKGLEPLALLIFDQKGIDPAAEGAAFVDPEKGVESIGQALAGARDIIAEMINEDTVGGGGGFARRDRRTAAPGREALPGDRGDAAQQEERREPGRAGSFRQSGPVGHGDQSGS